MPDNIKRINVKFLLDSGLLFEINRQILHPLGLALEVCLDDDGDASIRNLWDYRDDTEGMLFGDETYQHGLDKFERFMQEFGYAQLERRRAAVGYTVQPAPEDETDG